jgi:carboxypeptidase Taq
MAAQLYAAAERDLEDLDDRVREGEVDPLTSWLRDRIHRHGKRYETGDLVRRATGEAFTADAFTDHVTGKFGALYDL